MKHMTQFVVISLTALAALSFPAPVPSQTTLAIHGGMNRATLSELEEVKAFKGITLGASATIPIQDKLSFRLDGNYVQKGIEAASEDEFVRMNLGLDYVEVSGLGAVNLTPTESPASVYALAGPSVAFRTRCELKMEGSQASSSEGVSFLFSESCSDRVSGVDFGVTGGVGANVGISKQITFSVDLRYTLGIGTVFDDFDEGDPPKNRNFILQCGVGFPIGK